MAISLLFSFWLYNISLNEIRSTIQRTPGPVERVLLLENNKYAVEVREVKQQAIKKARSNLLYQFFIINVVIATGGSFVSYYLARRSLKPIEQAHNRLERFTADASHELRTPITAMRAENELALTEKKLSTKRARDQLSSNIEELDKLSELIESLLMLARLDRDNLRHISINAATVVEEAVSRTLSQAEAKNQLIVTNSTAGDIHGDQTSLTEAIVTLIENAVKYSPEKTTIIVGNHFTKDACHITVRDEGIGIDKKDLPHIFDRFYRADNSRTKHGTKGYGIGLAIAREFIQAHNGTITVKSAPKKGATFTVSLPLSK